MANQSTWKPTICPLVDRWNTFRLLFIYNSHLYDNESFFYCGLVASLCKKKLVSLAQSKTITPSIDQTSPANEVICIFRFVVQMSELKVRWWSLRSASSQRPTSSRDPDGCPRTAPMAMPRPYPSPGWTWRNSRSLWPEKAAALISRWDRVHSF